MEIYEPREDSQLIKGLIRDFARGRILDMGTGSGILAQEARKYSEDVTGADINPEAIDYCRRNIEEVNFIKSDLFSDIEGEFDLITFNPPYLPQEEGQIDLALYGGKKGYETIVRFLDSCADHLSKEGNVLLLFSQLTHKAVIEKAIYENFLEWQEIASKQIFFESLYVYLIRKSSLRIEIEKKGIKGLRYLAKGKRGVVYTGYLGETKVTLKTKRPDSEAIGRIENEASWLVKLNKKGIGPSFIGSGKDYLIYRFVEGEFFDRFLEKQEKEKIREVLLDIAEQARILDRMKVDKEEMHRLTKNLLIANRPVLIDFERCRIVKGPRNVTQFFQFMNSTRISAMLRQKGFSIDKDMILQATRAYKKTYAEQDFRKILELID